MSLSPQQEHKNCEQFLNRTQSTGYYQRICEVLLQWQRTKRSSQGAIQAFVKITTLIRDREELVHQLNKCLDKKASVPLQSTRAQIITAARNHGDYNLVFDSVQNLLKNDSHAVESLPEPIKVQQLTDEKLLSKIQQHPQGGLIVRVIYIYIKCIITLQEFRRLLLPLHRWDQRLYQHLSHLAEQIEAKRRKVTIFAPLNELVDQNYPLKQIGPSYSKTPDGYANFGKGWAKNPLEFVLNRRCVSVPLGQQSSFIIAKKNQFQEQLFDNQSQKYEIDIGIQNLKMAIKHIQKVKNSNPEQPKCLESLLLENLINKLYPSQNIYKIIIQKPQAAIEVILPRLEQKLGQLEASRKRFEKHCKEIAIKNYEKSLDYRCFYFKKNDKKFNSSMRYDEQIKLRINQILNESDKKQEQSGPEDRYSMQMPRNFTLNTFDNITKERCIEEKQINLNYQRKLDAEYPKFPYNQILFILNFSDLDVLNDVLEVVLYHCSKKNILQLILIKLMGFFIQRRLRKDINTLKYLDQKTTCKQNSGQNQNSNVNMGFDLLNQKKEKKTIKDVNVNFQFYDLIEQEIEPTLIQNIQSPFEGPDQHTFIATKAIYHFVRNLLTLYQRFLKAKQISDQRSKTIEEEYQPSTYSLFLTALTLKFKDQKLPDYLRTILKKDAFMFLTLDKIINNQTKIINNITPDTITYKIIKDGTKDFETQISKWQQFKLPSTNSQLVRVFSHKDTFFRFSYQKSQGNIYVSAWKNQWVQDIGSNFRHHIYFSVSQKKVSKPYRKKNKKTKEPADFCNLYSEFFHISGNQKMHMKGQELIIRYKQQNDSRKRIGQKLDQQVIRELRTLKKIKLNRGLNP